MTSFRLPISGTILGSWVVLALLSPAVAETGSSGIVPVTSNWEQRVLGRGHPPATGPQYTMASQRVGRRWAPRRQGYYLSGPIRTVSAEVESGAVVPHDAAAMGNVEVIPPGQRIDPMSLEDAADGYEVPANFGEGPGMGWQGCATCGGMGCDQCYETCPGECSGYCGVGCGPCGLPWLGWGGHGGWLRNFSIFAGVHGFKGPFDLGQNGNFGLHEGVNFGSPLGGPCGVGYQVGFQAVHSNFSGAGTGPGSDRNQIFFTTGIFRRALCGGLQWGVAFDLLHDSYYASAEMKQIRAELALVRAGCREIGFWGAFGVGDDNFTLHEQMTLALEPTDLYAFFYRRYFSGGGQGRVWTGLTGEGDAIFGADCTVPLGTSWALQTNFNYLIPEEGSAAGGQQEESWGVMIQLVWYPGRPARCVFQNPYHPLFNVADNSVFMLDRRP